MKAEVAEQTKTGADVVVEILEAQGTKYIFGVPGAKIDKVFDTLRDSSIQTVVCRHEQNAAFIAGGIGRMTGKAGVAIATSGPGVSNLVTGLATAHSEGDPMVALGGAVPVAERLKSVHQTMDSVSICKPITKYAAEVDSPASTAEVRNLSGCRSYLSRAGALQDVWDSWPTRRLTRYWKRHTWCSPSDTMPLNTGRRCGTRAGIAPSCTLTWFLLNSRTAMIRQLN